MAAVDEIRVLVSNGTCRPVRLLALFSGAAKGSVSSLSPLSPLLPSTTGLLEGTTRDDVVNEVPAVASGDAEVEVDVVVVVAAAVVVGDDAGEAVVRGGALGIAVVVRWVVGKVAVVAVDLAEVAVALAVVEALALVLALFCGSLSTALPSLMAEWGMGRPDSRQLVRRGRSRVPSDRELSHSSRTQAATVGRNLSSSRAARQRHLVSVALQVDDFCTQLATQKGRDKRPAASACWADQRETAATARGSQRWRSITIAFVRYRYYVRTVWRRRETKV